MGPYIAIFLIALISIELAIKNRKNNFIFYSFSILSVGSLVLLAALRSADIGTDTEVYLDLFNSARYYKNILDFITYNSSYEPGFSALVYICYKLNDSSVFYLMCVHLLVILPIYVSAVKMREYVNPTLFLFLFLFAMYNESLNISRQYIAVAFSLLAFVYMLNKNVLKYLIIMCVAVSIHSSALVCLSFPIIVRVSSKYTFRDHMLMYIMIMLLLLFLAFSIGRIASMLGLTFIDNKMSSYMQNGSSSISLSILIYYIFQGVFLGRMALRHQGNMVDAFFLLSIISIVFCTTGTLSVFFYRLSLYSELIVFLAMSYLMKKKSNRGYKVFLVLFTIFYWYFTVVLRGSNATIPYQLTNFI